MKILYVNISSKGEGGAEYYLNSLAGLLNEQGHEGRLICAEGDEKDTVFDKVYFLSEIWEKELSMSRSLKGEIDSILDDYAPDVVYLHNINNPKVTEYILSKCRTIRYIHDHKTVDPDGKMLLHDPIEINKDPLSSSCFVKAYTRKSMPRNPLKGVKAYLRATGSLKAAKELDKLIVASEYMKNNLIVNGVDKDKIAVIPYFADLKECSPLSGEYSHLLFAGRLAEGKGGDVLLDVMKTLGEDVVLDVVGSGPRAEGLIGKAIKMGVSERVTFYGWKRHDELQGFYCDCSVLVVPSVWPEPFGICGIEAAMSGKPAVAFNVGGISDWLIDGETGFLVEPYDKEKMAEKIKILLEDNDLRKKMGNRARERAVEKYSPERHIDRLMGVFGEVLGGS